jgi:hypothetical protein
MARFLLLAALAGCAPSTAAIAREPAAVAPPAAPTTTVDDPHKLHIEARTKAAKSVEAGDLEAAATALVTVMPTLAKHPELADEFWAHNAMMMIRAGQGDPAAALAENDQATLAAERGTWSTAEERNDLAFQKDRWHRAYLTRMLAESRSGSTKTALVQYAEAALADYRTKGFPDSIAILDAYFAALDGKKEAALTAAKKVDPVKNGDIEDLYLVVIGLEAGGDHPGAEAVRKQMRAAKPGSIARAIMLRWLDLDAQGKGFTPWHAQAAAARPAP